MRTDVENKTAIVFMKGTNRFNGENEELYKFHILILIYS